MVEDGATGPAVSMRWLQRQHDESNDDDGDQKSHGQNHMDSFNSAIVAELTLPEVFLPTTLS